MRPRVKEARPPFQRWGGGGGAWMEVGGGAVKALGGPLNFHPRSSSRPAQLVQTVAPAPSL